MSQTETRISVDDVVQFVDDNTTPSARWCTREEIVWVLSWYGSAESEHVQTALQRAEDTDRLVARRNEYTVPELAP